ncbi:hypothetical protein C7445_108121 [Alicyclobacillus sacchari]|uniref:Uncharacterized protein n=1 Tax=Alicyclobacillus sacchari TaxID=392010 RepID=A0A4R8LL39_9BACL|nr:hypothetical protein C7445_108121 [Alicyclobacillus sacchari]
MKIGVTGAIHASSMCRGSPVGLYLDCMKMKSDSSAYRNNRVASQIRWGVWLWHIISVFVCASIVNIYLIERGRYRQKAESKRC